MHNTKLVQIVSTFSQKERKRLEKLFRSPFFNENQQLIALIQYLVANLEKNKKEILEKEIVFAHIYPEEKYNELKMRRLISDAFQLVEQFISQLYTAKNPINQSLNVLKYYQEKNIENIYASQVKQITEEQTKISSQNASYYYTQYEILLTEVVIQTQNMKREGIDALMPTVEQLDIFYIARKLEFYCTLLTQSTVISTSIPVSFWEEISDLTHKKPHLQAIPIIAFYRTLLNLLHYPEDTSYFEETIALLQQHPLLFNPVELQNIYATVRNYCIAKINAGNKDFEYKLWELYDNEIHNEVFLKEEKEIFPATFKNMIVLGIRLHKVAEVEAIIQQYQIYLSPVFREDVVNYCQAKVHFYKKEFRPIIKLLNQLQYDDIFFQIDVRKLLIQTYFELKEIEHLQSAMNSLRVYLYRNKTLSPSHKESNIQFLMTLNKMTGLLSAAKKEKLIAQIRLTPRLAERAWLLEKLM